MAERKSDTRGPSGESEPAGSGGSDDPESAESGTEARRSRSLGRRIAVTLVWAGVAYLVIVGLVSVIPQVFWPERGEVPASVTCAGGLHDLRAELLTRAGDLVATGGEVDSRGLRRYLHGWDRRYLGLEGRCHGDDAKAWVLLGRLRQRLESRLLRFDAEEGALAREMDHTLARHER